MPMRDRPARGGAPRPSVEPTACRRRAGDMQHQGSAAGGAGKPPTWPSGPSRPRPPDRPTSAHLRRQAGEGRAFRNIPTRAIAPRAHQRTLAGVDELPGLSAAAGGLPVESARGEGGARLEGGSGGEALQQQEEEEEEEEAPSPSPYPGERMHGCRPKRDDMSSIRLKSSPPLQATKMGSPASPKLSSHSFSSLLRTRWVVHSFHWC